MSVRLSNPNDEKEFKSFAEMAGTLAIIKVVDDVKFNDDELKEIAEVAKIVDAVVKTWNHQMTRRRFSGTFGEFLAKILKARQRLGGK